MFGAVFVQDPSVFFFGSTQKKMPPKKAGPFVFRPSPKCALCGDDESIHQAEKWISSVFIVDDGESVKSTADFGC